MWLFLRRTLHRLAINLANQVQPFAGFGLQQFYLMRCLYFVHVQKQIH